MISKMVSVANTLGVILRRRILSCSPQTEIARYFPTSESVNDALRNLLELVKKLSLQSTNAEL
jgi:hypothetical protein